MNPPNRPSVPPAATANRPDPVATIDSRQLFGPGRSTVFIDHGGQRYTLRLTRENKLILTK